MNMTIIMILLALTQDVMNQDISMRVDAQGNASAEIEFQLSAKGWLMWKAQYGEHPDILKRDLTHRFSMYEITDFSLTKDDVSRKATAKLRLLGQGRYLGDGKFEIQVPAEWKKVAEGGNVWTFSTTQIMGQDVALNQTIRVLLPEGARAMKLGAANDGQQSLTYELPTSSGFTPWPILSAIGVLGLAITSVLRFRS
jgi:hypothetical protein